MTYVNWRTCVIRGLRKRNPEQRQRKPRAVYWRSGQGTAGQHHFFPCFRYPKAQHICWRTFPTVEELCSRERSDTTRTCVEGFVSLSISFQWKGVVKSQKKQLSEMPVVFFFTCFLCLHLLRWSSSSFIPESSLVRNLIFQAGPQDSKHSLGSRNREHSTKEVAFDLTCARCCWFLQHTAFYSSIHRLACWKQESCPWGVCVCAL